jgi:hypothetical protein
MNKTYKYTITYKGTRLLTYDWIDDKGDKVERTVTDSNLNAFFFLLDCLDRLGYSRVR